MASTIKDIRAETGLALSTISKYMNGGNVRRENREKIEAAVRKLNYRPNQMARALITRKTKTVAFVINVVSTPFSGWMLKYAGEFLRRQGYSLMICDSNNTPELEAENIRFCLDKKVDGILLLPVGMDSAPLQPALNAGVPVVLVDREIDTDICDCITIDNAQAAGRGVSCLIGCGHRRIAVIHSMEYTGYQRFLGYRQAMEAAGLPIPPEYVRSGQTHSTELGYTSMKQLLALPQPPTAVLMTNYEVGLGAVMALNEHRVECPKDISLVGFDELVQTLVMKPEMTVLSQPMEQMCQEAVRLLLKRIDEDEKAPPCRISMYASLKQGQSVRSIC